MLKTKLKCASFFAGVGGIDEGFDRSNLIEQIYANEFDSSPAKTFDMNSKVKADVRDIRDVEPDQIGDFDVCLAGFPCQAFSIAGYRQGFKDEKGRGELFFEVARLIDAKKPHVVFLENVKNLVGHDGGNTFRIIIKTLRELGYYPKWQVLNAMDYGNVPQNRERIYIVAFRNPEAYLKFEFPEPVPLKTRLEDVIDFHSKLDDKYYYTPGKYKGDIYDKLAEAMADDREGNRSVYQWRRHYVRRNMSGVVPTLTANMGEGGHNVPLVKTDFGIRKLTPRECFNVQGFPRDFKLPTDVTESKLYKQAGNSVCVSVIQRIAEQIYKAVDEVERGDGIANVEGNLFRMDAEVAFGADFATVEMKAAKAKAKVKEETEDENVFDLPRELRKKEEGNDARANA